MCWRRLNRRVPVPAHVRTCPCAGNIRAFCSRSSKPCSCPVTPDSPVVATALMPAWYSPVIAPASLSVWVFTWAAGSLSPCGWSAVVFCGSQQQLWLSSLVCSQDRNQFGNLPAYLRRLEQAWGKGRERAELGCDDQRGPGRRDWGPGVGLKEAGSCFER